MTPEPAPARDHGSQPLDALMLRLGLANRDLVEASAAQLTHKQVQRGRKGRYLTPKMRRKIVAAFRAACAARGEAPAFGEADLFTYAARNGEEPRREEA